MQKEKYWEKVVVVLILILIIGFSFYIYRNEFKVLSDPNDNIFQYGLIDQAKNIWKNIFAGKLSPFYLLDNWNERWGDGFALSNYYSHLPQALFGLVGGYRTFVIFRTLLLITMPLMFFWAGSILGLPWGFNLILAFFSQVIFTNGLYGIDVSSFIWRGWGLSAELMATFLMPVAFAYSVDFFENKHNLGKAVLFNFLCAEAHIGIFLLLLIGYSFYLPWRLFLFIFTNLKLENFKLQISNFKLDRVKLTNLWKDAVFPFFKFNFVTLFLLSYYIVPFFTQGQYRNFSVWDPIWKFNSWGAKQVIVWFLNGELFDYSRFPFITLCVIFGLLYGLIEKKRIFNYLSLLFIFFTVLFFGKTTLGKIVDLIPGFSEYHIHRVIVAVQFLGLILGAWFLYKLLEKTIHFNLNSSLPLLKQKISKNFGLLILSVLILVCLFTIYSLEQPVVKYAEDNNNWITRSNNAYLYDLDSYNKIKAKLASLPPARVYAGRPGNWGKNFYVGETPMYMNLSRDGFPTIEFLPESWSPNSDPEQFFDENNLEYYNLYNVGYSVLPPEINPPSFAKLILKEGRYSLYQIPTSGWFDFGKANLMIRSPKTDLLNITRLWFGSKSFKSGYHPVIDLNSKESLDSTPLWSGKLWQIQMTDLNHFVNLNDGKERDIWVGNPFDALRDQTFSKTTFSQSQVLVNGYQTEVTINKDCKNCFIILKQSFHPNWKVILDGSIVSPFPVFPFFIGIPVETAGTHKIVATYEPGTLKVILVWVEILGFGGWLVWKKFKFVK